MKLLITREIPNAGINLLKQHPEIEIKYLKGDPLTPEQLKKEMTDVDAIIPVIPDRITEEHINNAKKLKVIATYSVGYDHIDTISATKNNVYVTNTPGDLTESVAEFTFALLMTLSKNIVASDEFCRQGKYKFWEPMKFIGTSLRGKKVGIVGFGRIGQQFARMCKYGLGMDVYYTDPIEHYEAEKLLDATKLELNDLLGTCDIVSLHCNLNESTHHLIADKEFALMKPDALLINTARGPVICEKSLVRALKNHIISGAALDVFEDEPTINKELKDLYNVVLTSHIASATYQARIEMATMAAKNVIDVLIHKKEPQNLVNKDVLKKTVTSLV